MRGGENISNYNTEIIKSPIKAIRAKCIDCCCGEKGEVKLCPCENCALYPFRFGKNPFHTRRQLTEEEKEELSKRLSDARLVKNND